MFRYSYSTTLNSGASERLIQEFRQSQVVLGKGGESHIVLQGQRIAPVHARLVLDGATLKIFDAGGLAGVRLNQRRVSSATVRNGDVIVLGDVQIVVSIEDDWVNLSAAPTQESRLSEKTTFVDGLEQLRVESYLPAMRHVVLGVLTLSILAFCVYPLAARDFSPWNSGPISNAHSLIAQDCQKCHADPFSRVQDRECLYCHEMSKHAPSHASFVESHPSLAMRCAQCHMEHNGDHGLIRQEAHFCIGCHAEIQTLKPDSVLLNVTHFKSHPQFRVAVKGADGVVEQVAVDSQDKAIDRTAIKFNHNIHLKPDLRGPGGEQTLSCASCHEPDKDYKGITPVSFQRHCQNCHTLGFDERVPDLQVPHGNAELVYPALFTEYTKLSALQGQRLTGEAQYREQRLLPSDQGAAKDIPLTVSDIQRSARDAEHQLFTRTGCFLCHEFQEKGEAERAETAARYKIVAPSIPNNWLPRARFSHGAHEEFSCESCHEKVRNSLESSDILLPGVHGCQQCHAQDAKPGYVESGCVTCHSYHVAIGFPGEKKQTITDYLNSLTR